MITQTDIFGNVPLLVVQDNCPYALKCIAALVNSGLSFSIVDVSKYSPQSPHRKIPLLEWSGRLVFESGIICDLVDRLGNTHYIGEPIAIAEAKSWGEYASVINVALFKVASNIGTWEYDNLVQALTETLVRLEEYLDSSDSIAERPIGILEYSYLSFFIRAREMEELLGVRIFASDTFPNLACLSTRALQRFWNSHEYVESFQLGFRAFISSKAKATTVEIARAKE